MEYTGGAKENGITKIQDRRPIGHDSEQGISSEVLQFQPHRWMWT
jgi:hypothetical protein